MTDHVTGEPTTCRMQGCNRSARARGLCKMHWTRWRKHGDPSFVSVQGVDYNVKAVCSVEQCDRTGCWQGLCQKHLWRLQKHGDPHAVPPQEGRDLKGDVPASVTIHKRLRKHRGPAHSYRCVDCDGRAREWSYDHLDSGAIQASTGPYSLDLAHYEPRCISCHRKFDASWEKRGRTASGQFPGKAAVRV